jgi:hypothetical protein
MDDTFHEFEQCGLSCNAIAVLTCRRKLEIFAEKDYVLYNPFS